MVEKEVTIEMKRPKALFLTFFLLFVLALELAITFGSPVAFGDEAGHTYWAKYMAEQIEMPIKFPLYGSKVMGGLEFGRPPLWNLLVASFYLILGFHEAIVKFLTPFVCFLTGIAMYVMASKAFNRNVAVLASIIAVTIPSYVTYSVLFYVDVLFVLYFTLGTLLVILASRDWNPRYWLMAGIYLSFAILTKVPGFVIFPMLLIFFVFQASRNKALKQTFLRYSLLLLMMSLILVPEFMRTYHRYGNVGIIGFRPKPKLYDYEPKHRFERMMMPGEVTLLEHGLTGYVRFAYGNLWFVPFIFMAGLFLLSWKSKIEHRLLILSLLPFLLIAYMTFRGRTEDMARYMLGSTALVALTSALYLEEVGGWLNRYFKHLGIVVLLFVLVGSYLNLREKLSIMGRVKQFSPSFFEACEWVRENLPKNATLLSLWGHQTVYHCQRSSVWNMPELPDIMLGQDLNLTLSRFDFHGITHVFLPKFSIIQQRFSQGYWIGFVQLLEQNPQTFIKVYENGPELQTCLAMGGCDGVKIYEVRFA
jgi:4-amino-4-deoxy-L-arabinose transferase-like glycosyltransferase